MDPLKSMMPILMGFGLAAACGFRVFVPLLIVSLAANTGYLSVGPGWEWLGQWPAVLCLAVATLLEIGAYYIPWVDNLLDTISTPAAAVAGTIVAANFIPHMHPLLKWTLAAILGGGAASAVQVATVGARAVSTATTAGLGNFVVATGESVGAVGVSLLALALPFLSVLLVLAVIGLLAVRLARRHRPAGAMPSTAPAGK